MKGNVWPAFHFVSSRSRDPRVESSAEKDAPMMEAAIEGSAEAPGLFLSPARIKVDPDQEQIDIENEMNEEPEDDDSDDDLFIQVCLGGLVCPSLSDSQFSRFCQALRERLRAAAQLHAIGEKLPFGFHFDMVPSTPKDVVTFRRANSREDKENDRNEDDDDAKPAEKHAVKQAKVGWGSVPDLR
jgi:hypothetical protein